MAQQIEKLAQFVAETQLEQIPDAVQRHAKLVILDMIGVILAGAERPEVHELRERLSTTAGTGATVFARGWPCVTLVAQWKFSRSRPRKCGNEARVWWFKMRCSISSVSTAALLPTILAYAPGQDSSWLAMEALSGARPAFN